MRINSIRVGLAICFKELISEIVTALYNLMIVMYLCGGGGAGEISTSSLCQLAFTKFVHNRK